MDSRDRKRQRDGWIPRNSGFLAIEDPLGSKVEVDTPESRTAFIPSVPDGITEGVLLARLSDSPDERRYVRLTTPILRRKD